MKLLQLFESTSDDLFRKIDSLDAVIADRAATDGEKDNARRLKSALEARLKKEFPTAKRSPKTTQSTTTSHSSGGGGWDANFWADMARDAAEYYDREERWKKNPEEKEKFYKDRLETLKRKRKALSTGRGIGDVELEAQYQEISNEIERILRNHFPEEYKKILQKRDKKSSKDSARRYAKRVDQLKAKKAAAQKSGKRTFSEVGKEYNDALKRFHKLMKDNNAIMRISGYGDAKLQSFKTGGQTLQNLAYIKSLRNLWNELSPEDQQAVKAAAEEVNEFGYNAKGYTPAQKKKVLDQMRPSKAPGGPGGPSKRYVFKNGKWYDLKLNKVKVVPGKEGYRSDIYDKRYKWVDIK